MVSPRKRPRPVQEKEQKVVGVDPRLPPVTDSKSCKSSKLKIKWDILTTKIIGYIALM